MLDRVEDTKRRMEILRKDYLMSTRDIAKVMGVNQCVIMSWRKGNFNITKNHYDQLCDIMVRLTGKNIRYKKQAMDILLDGDEDGE